MKIHLQNKTQKVIEDNENETLTSEDRQDRCRTGETP